MTPIQEDKQTNEIQSDKGTTRKAESEKEHTQTTL